MFRSMCLCHCRLCKPGYYRRNDQPFLYSPHQKDFCSGRSCTGIHCAEFSHCRRSPDCRSVPGIPAQCRSRRMAVDPGAVTFSWLSVFIGVTSNSPEGASSLFTLVIALPYLSSGFVPLDAMPGPLAAFARYQPMTPVIETMRSAFLGMPLDIETAMISLLWCMGLTAVFCFCSLVFFRKTAVFCFCSLVFFRKWISQ